MNTQKPLKLKQEHLATLYRLLGAFKTHVNDDGYAKDAIGLIQGWVYQEIEDEDLTRRNAPPTWFEAESTR
jgi:hypothetical protein